MTDWGGFTEDDLRRMRQNVKSDNGSSPARRGFTRGQRGRPPRGQSRVQSSNQNRPHTLPHMENQLPNEQRLSQPKDQPTDETRAHRSIPQPKSDKDTSHTVKKSNVNNNTGTGMAPQSNTEGNEEKISTQTEKTEKDAITDDNEILKLELSNLDNFRSQQKQIEELNKKKRQILASAILERQKKAKAESVKLTRIQKELEKLDQLLTVDVSLIRDRIEDASRHYMDAQKRFDKAEKEYIESKMELFSAQELKEQLTEHLYTVIQQNEIRKAQKLKELMDKLEMESEGDNSDVSELVKSMHMPSLTVLNAMTTTPQHRIGSHNIVTPPTTPQTPPSDKTVANQSGSASDKALTNQSEDPEKSLTNQSGHPDKASTDQSGHPDKASTNQSGDPDNVLANQSGDSQGVSKAANNENSDRKTEDNDKQTDKTSISSENKDTEPEILVKNERKVITDTTDSVSKESVQITPTAEIDPSKCDSPILNKDSETQSGTSLNVSTVVNDSGDAKPPNKDGAKPQQFEGS